MRRSVAAFAVGLCLASGLPGSASAADWPASGASEIGRVGQPGYLPGGYEPSGAVWHAGLGRLVIVGDDGDVTIMDADGESMITWVPGGDLEGIAVADPGSDRVYLAVENPDSVVEFDLDSGLLTGASWDLTPWMTGAGNKGLEALTYADGLFYAGHQGEGNIYVFDLLDAGGVIHVATLPPPFGRDDVSGLHYDEHTQILFAIYDSHDVIVEMTLAGALIREYTLAGNDQEGVALVPDCSAATASIYIAEDSAQLWRYADYPIDCVACNDGLDDDGDGLVDWDGGGLGDPDPGCSDAADTDELDPALACDDGVDNDLDGRADFDPVTFADPAGLAGLGDPGCRSPDWFREDPACQDGVNNDVSLGTDFDGGASVPGAPIDPNGADPACAGKPWRNSETRASSCGMGIGLALLMPALFRSRLRRRRSRLP